MPRQGHTSNHTYKIAAIAISVLFVIAAIYGIYVTNLVGALHQQVVTLNSENSALVMNLTNLTHTYNLTIFSGKTINLSKYNSTHTYAGYQYVYNVTYGLANFSFDVPYSGYILFNATSTLDNSNKSASCNWVTVVTAEKPYYLDNSSFTSVSGGHTYNYTYNYLGGAKISYDETLFPITTVCPLQSRNYVIPVNAGENYLIIYNYNSTRAAAITFNAKYVGYPHSS